MRRRDLCRFSGRFEADIPEDIGTGSCRACYDIRTDIRDHPRTRQCLQINHCTTAVHRIL